jgi:hypothetical protein
MDDQTARVGRAERRSRQRRIEGAAFGEGVGALLEAPARLVDAVARAIQGDRDVQSMRAGSLPPRRSTRDRVLANARTTVGRIRRDMENVE